MAKRKQVTPEARAARDMLLRRAQWIVDSNIMLACGHTPQLPDDLTTFMDPGLPQPQLLAGLLKSVMPAIELADDRVPVPDYLNRTKMEQAESVLEQFNQGTISIKDVGIRLRAIQQVMDMEDTITLMNVIRQHNEK